jgi:oxygen-dependent protoporphyrinogen oxidase
MAEKRVAIIGAGIGGLATAQRLLEHGDDELELHVFEARERAGGAVWTDRVDGYLVEGGADMFITDKPWAVELCEHLGLAGRLMGTDPRYRRSFVLRDGRPTPVPDGFMLMAPANPLAVLRTPLFSPLGKLRMGLELLVPPETHEDHDESVASFVRRRFGQELLERLVQPLIGGIYTGDPEKLSLKATLPRFIDMERQYRSLIVGAQRKSAHSDASQSGARYGMFVGFPDGMRELVEGLHRAVGQQRIRFGVRVRHVERLDDGYRLQLHDGTSERFDALVLAMPAYAAAQLVEPFARALCRSLDAIEYASSVVVVSGHRMLDIAHPLNAAGLVVPDIEGRDVIAVSFTSRKFPGRAPEGRVLLRSFVGGALHPEMFSHSDDELVASVRRELRDMLGVVGEPDFMRAVRHERAMPQYHVGHLARVARIEHQLEEHPSLALAGNAYRGVGIPDVVHSGQQAAERVLEYLSPGA